jgi:ArsR family transcriptional regulator
MKMLASHLRTFADETRLRTLRLLLEEELNAGELTDILGLAQSAVSRQITLLREAGLVSERRAGRYAYYSIAPESGATPDWQHVRARLSAAPDEHGDLARLEDVRRARREQQVADGDGRSFVPGRSWAAWARALTWLIADDLQVVDLGCGDGALTLEIARFAKRVVGVDRRPALLRGARATARRAGAKNVSFRKADMQSLPYEDGRFDLAVLSQSLHYASDPAAALIEAARVVAPGGRVLVVDLLPHDEVWVRERLDHIVLGFTPGRLRELLRGAGLRRVRVERLPGRSGEPFRALLGLGVRRGRKQ